MGFGSGLGSGFDSSSQMTLTRTLVSSYSTSYLTFVPSAWPLTQVLVHALVIVPNPLAIVYVLPSYVAVSPISSRLPPVIFSSALPSPTAPRSGDSAPYSP